MSIASKSDHNQMVHGVKSKIRKKTAGNTSPCPKYARADFQNPSEDQAILMARYGPRPNNRRHLSAVQEMFGRKSGHASARHQLEPELCSKLETCFAVYPRLLAKIVTGTSSAFTAAFS